jgi:hypothetical protein
LTRSRALLLLSLLVTMGATAFFLVRKASKDQIICANLFTSLSRLACANGNPVSRPL